MSRQIAPVVLSIVLIVAVAILRSYSKTLAALTATMPINIPLALWIVYSANGGDQATLVDFTGSLLVGIVGTVACVAAMWLAARAGLRLAPTIAVGYLAWAVVSGGCLAMRYVLAR
jgi:hypothetical protein